MDSETFFSDQFFFFFFFFFWQNYYHNGVGAGAAPGCLLRGGGGERKIAKNVSLTAVRALKFCASPEKVARRGGGGGTPTHFFPTSNIFPNIFHNGVGVPSWP